MVKTCANLIALSVFVFVVLLNVCECYKYLRNAELKTLPDKIANKLDSAIRNSYNNDENDDDNDDNDDNDDDDDDVNNDKIQSNENAYNIHRLLLLNKLRLMTRRSLESVDDFDNGADGGSSVATTNLNEKHLLENLILQHELNKLKHIEDKNDLKQNAGFLKRAKLNIRLLNKKGNGYYTRPCLVNVLSCYYFG